MEIEKKVALLYKCFLLRRRTFPFISTIFMVGFIVIVHGGIIIEGFQLFKNYQDFTIGSLHIDANRLFFIVCTYIR
jgi:hypothetical protein